MILLWGSPLDSPIAAVRRVLDRDRHAYVLVDPRQVLTTQLEYRLEEGHLTGKLETPEAQVQLSDFRGAYLRPADPTRIPAVSERGPGSREFHHAVQVHDALRLVTELCAMTVVNSLRAMASNSSKPYQARQIERVGFSTPPTLLTTTPEAVATFAKQNGEMIYKSISGVRSIVAKLDDHTKSRLGHVNACPTQFQKWIAGVDFRVHVIGDAIFATRIDSDATDYRYATKTGQAPRLTPTRLSADEESRCRQLARSLGLLVAGIDLRLTPEGNWVCFEVNPSPAFTYYAENEAMAEALSALLLNPPGDAGPQSGSSP